MDRRDKLEYQGTQIQIQEWINKGKSRQYVMDRLQEDGMTVLGAQEIYYATLKEMAPDPNLFDDYKKQVIQQNLDRLEKIVESSIDGNYQEKNVALKAIDTLNKLIGAYSDSNSVTIAKDNQGQEIIRIEFQK